jgi:outer membrane protein W
MNKTALCFTMTALVLLVSASASAQSKMSVGAGFDIMLPVGSFGDSWGTGFGGTAEFDYAFTQNSSVTGKTGYLTWSGKNLPSGVSATYGGVPLLVGVRYYPHLILSATGSIRPYGHLELGLMFGSVSGSGHILTITESKTDFTIVPSLGVEIPAGSNGAVDISVRYFDIASKGSIGFRAGYKMAI